MRGLPRSPAVPSGLFALECGTTCSARSHLAMSPLYPGCPFLPLPPIWMNVSSLTPWFSDFHTVQFSGSSGYFLFLICCCPSFGCARRQSVSVYSPILGEWPAVSPLSLAARLHRCHTNHSPYINNGWTFQDRPRMSFVSFMSKGQATLLTFLFLFCLDCEVNHYFLWKGIR